MSGATADRGGATAQPAGPEPASAGTSWGRRPLATAVLSLPTLLVLAVLLAAGLLPVAAAAGGAVVVLALVAVLLNQHFRRVRALTRYLGRLPTVRDDRPLPPAPSGGALLSPGLGEAISRAASDQREQI